MGGCVNIYETRRTFYERVKYWKRDLTKPTSELVHEPCSGVFYAREINAENLGRDDVDDSFTFDDTDSMLITRDDVSDLKPNDICEYDGRTWLVTNIQRKKRHKRSELVKESTFIYYISLKE